MDLRAVRRAIADAAKAVTPKLSCHPYPPAVLQARSFFVVDVQVDWDRAHARGLDAVTLTARLLSGAADQPAAHEQVDVYLAGAGTGSLKDAIEAIRPSRGGALASSGVAHDLHVRRFTGVREYEHAGGYFVGGDLEIYVIGPGT